MKGPSGIREVAIGRRIPDPNDVSASRLLTFERKQRAAVARLTADGRFDAIHRATPSGYKDSLLPISGLPLVLGPILMSDEPPASFDSVLHPPLPRRFSITSLVERGTNRWARHIFHRQSTSHQMLESARIIFVGSRVTIRRVPIACRNRCRLIPYAGVDAALYAPPAGGRSCSSVELLYVGRLVPYKGVELLIRAAAIARRRCHFALRIVGGADRGYRNYCESLVAQLGLADIVTFHGNQPRALLSEYYQRAHIFCMPSIETYGMAILEAMSSGCAVLTTDFNGPGEIVQPGTGRKVALRNPRQFVEEYAEQICDLVGNAPLRKVLGARARAHVLEHHNWVSIQAKILNLYEDVFTSKAAPTAAIAATERCDSGAPTL
jgi:glycosyltransferase involved in cell wall biosynthesis